MAERVLLVAIEAMEISLVRQGVAEGWLPAIAALLEEGTAVRLAHAPDLLPGAGWTTLTTGRPVQDHLLVFHHQLAPGTSRIEAVTGRSARVPVFWEMAGEAGVRSTVVSIHGAPRLEGFNGTQVHWGTGEPYAAEGGLWSDPPEVLDSLRRRWPGRRFGFLDRMPRSASEYRDYLDDACQQIRLQGEGLAHLMQATEWDFFFGNIFETHEAGHLLWHLQDGPGTDGLHQPMRRVYQEADAALGRLLAARDGGTRAFLVTTTGMRHNVSTHHVTRSFLRQGGWMAVADQAPAGDERWMWWASRARTAVHKVTPLAMRRALSRLAPDAHERMVAAGPLLGVDWSVTSAFPLPNDTTSAIRFNVAGREPAGIVEPGAGLRPTGRGDRRGRGRVGRRRHRNAGGEAGLPDGPVHGWSGGGRAARSWSSSGSGWWPRHSTVPARGGSWCPADPRTGDHRPEGFLIGAGPGMAHVAGGLDSDTAFGMLDVAPTLLAAMGVDVPAEPARPADHRRTARLTDSHAPSPATVRPIWKRGRRERGCVRHARHRVRRAARRRPHRAR